MSFVPDHDTRVRVVSLKEIVLIILFFSTILGLLHSRDVFEKLLLSEKSNYDLTEAYLRNLIRLEPKNSDLLFRFVDVLIHQGKYDLAEHTLRALEVSTNPSDRLRAQKLRYEILKHLYFSTSDTEARQTLMKKLRTLIWQIVKEGDADQDLKYWLNESWFVESPRIRMEILKRMAAKYPKNVEILENLYHTAMTAKEKDTAKFAMEALIALHDRWIGTFEENPGRYREKMTMLAEYYLMNRFYRRAADVYLQLFAVTKENHYLFKALDVLIWGGRYDDAVILAKKYEGRFLSNEKEAKKILELYLKAGRVEEARRYSLKLLNRYGR